MTALGPTRVSLSPASEHVLPPSWPSLVGVCSPPSGPPPNGYPTPPQAARQHTAHWLQVSAPSFPCAPLLPPSLLALLRPVACGVTGT